MGAGLLPLALPRGLLSSPPAGAAEGGLDRNARISTLAEVDATERGLAVDLWKSGGPGVKATAEAALTGSDADLQAFLASAEGLSFQNNRVSAAQVESVAGTELMAAARKAMAGTQAELDKFLYYGWADPLEQDQRVRVAQVVDAGGPAVQAAGRAALAGSAQTSRSSWSRGSSFNGSRTSGFSWCRSSVWAGAMSGLRDVWRCPGTQRISRSSWRSGSSSRGRRIRSTTRSRSWPRRRRRPGDEVLATDPVTGESGPRKVTRLIRTEDDKHFNTLSITAENGVEELTATHEHPFWSPSEHTWIAARDLAPGMTLLTDAGDTVAVSGNKGFTERAHLRVTDDAPGTPVRPGSCR